MACVKMGGPNLKLSRALPSVTWTFVERAPGSPAAPSRPSTVPQSRLSERSPRGGREKTALFVRGGKVTPPVKCSQITMPMRAC